MFLQSKIELYVPSTTDVDIPTDTQPQVNRVAIAFTEWFGGATVSKGDGYYGCQDSHIVIEPVYIVWSYCTTQQLETYVIDVEALAKEICQILHQESIALVINNRMYFITAS